MADGKRVIRRLRRIRKPAKAALFPQRVELLVPARQQLVRIALMAHIPQQPIRGEIEDIIHGQAYFHGAQVGGKVAAVGAHGGHDHFAHFLGEVGQLVEGDFSEIGGAIDRLEEASH